MRSRAQAFGHGIHPMLIVFPLGLLATAVIFDIIYLITDRSAFNIAALLPPCVSQRSINA